MKIVTLSGSMRFKKEMMKVATDLELNNGYIVIQCVYFSDDKKLTDEDIKMLDELHNKKIELSDALFVVNVNGYIGESTKKEIEYAKNLGKEILYLEPID